jgi:uncharacterized membrane protein YbaN (DUF454 family)
MNYIAGIIIVVIGMLATSFFMPLAGIPFIILGIIVFSMPIDNFEERFGPQDMYSGNIISKKCIHVSDEGKTHMITVNTTSGTNIDLIIPRKKSNIADALTVGSSGTFICTKTHRLVLTFLPK